MMREAEVVKGGGKHTKDKTCSCWDLPLARLSMLAGRASTGCDKCHNCHEEHFCGLSSTNKRICENALGGPRIRSTGTHQQRRKQKMGGSGVHNGRDTWSQEVESGVVANLWNSLCVWDTIQNYHSSRRVAKCHWAVSQGPYQDSLQLTVPHCPQAQSLVPWASAEWMWKLPVPVI